MEKAALLIVTLLWQGHWFGGQPGTVAFQWSDAEKAQNAVVSWEVLHDKTPLGNGRLGMKPGNAASTVSITLPEVRVRTQVKLQYRVHSADGKQELASGERQITLYPKEILAPWAERVKAENLVVWDDEKGLPAVFKAAGLPCLHITGAGGLQMVAGDIILVGQDQIDASVFSQAELLEQAKAGSTIVLFSQKAPASLMESLMVEKASPAKLEWKQDHVLLKSFVKDDWLTLLTGNGLRAVQLEAGETVGAVVYWPAEKREGQAPNLDALVAVKPLGRGRVVFWQLPMGKWTEDPRSQLALAGVLDYVTGRKRAGGGQALSAVGASR